jgi:hypothetical protein
MVLGPSSEHAILIGRILWYLLTHIPEFYNEVVMKAEDMDYSSPKVVLLLLYMGVNRNHITISNNTFYLQDFVRILGGILFHCEHKRVGISTEKGIMMAEIRASVPMVCFAYFPRCNQLQKRHSLLF